MAWRELEASGLTFCCAIVPNSAHLAPALQCQCPLQGVPCRLSSPRQRLSPPCPLCFCFSSCSSYIPSPPVWSLFLHKDCHACPKMICSAPGLPDLPGPAAKTHLGEPLPLKSKSPEERKCCARIRCPHLVPFAIEACGSHQCGGRGKITAKGTLAP